MKSGDKNSGIEGHYCMPLVDNSAFLKFSVFTCFAEIRRLTWTLKNIHFFTSKITNLASAILCGSNKNASKTQLNCSIDKRKINIKLT